jgi:hypothetical protein
MEKLTATVAMYATNFVERYNTVALVAFVAVKKFLLGSSMDSRLRGNDVLKFVSILFVGLFLLAFPAYAQDGNVYTIKDVKVDVSAASATAARDQAFAQAQQTAFTQLAEQLLPESDFKAFKAPEAKAISPMIKDFEVTNEQLSSVRYIGTYTFRFRNSAVQSYFSGHNVRAVATESKPVLVLPFYEWGSRTVLWGAGNPWLAAWGRAETYKGLVPVTVPIGDAQDIADIGDTQALTFDATALAGLNARYEADRAVILIASPQWGSVAAAPDAVPPVLSVKVYKTMGGKPAFATTLKVIAEASDTPQSIYDRAVSVATKALQNDWKEQTVGGTTSAAANAVRAVVPFTSQRDWVALQQQLRRLSGVASVKTVSLSTRKAVVEVGYDGTEDALRASLAQQGLNLSPAPDYVLSTGVPY